MTFCQKPSKRQKKETYPAEVKLKTDGESLENRHASDFWLSRLKGHCTTWCPEKGKTGTDGEEMGKKPV